MKEIFTNKIIWKYKTQIDLILGFCFVFLIYLIIITDGNFFVVLPMITIIAISIIFNLLNIKFLIYKYIGNRINKFGKISIHEGGFYIGRFFLKNYNYYRRVDVDCFSWKHIKNYKWDEDKGQHQFGITFILDDGLKEKRNLWRDPLDFHQFNDLGNGLYQFKIYINRSFKDEITNLLQSYVTF